MASHRRGSARGVGGRPARAHPPSLRAARARGLAAQSREPRHASARRSTSGSAGRAAASVRTSASKLLGKLDEEGIRGTLALLESVQREVREEAPSEELAAAWAAAVAALPPDWSDLYCELELDSSDHLDRAALLLAPINPARVPGRSAFRFRVAHSFGYGASPQMTARCLERVDAEGITGRIAVLRALSDTHNVATQGPVWRVEGRAV